MKKLSCIIFILSIINICQAQEKINIDIVKSSIKWNGEYTFYFGGHEGFIGITEGHLLKTNDKIIGGSFEISMNTITNTDIEEGDANRSLIEHLQSDDFFNIKDHPTSKLNITKIEYSSETQARVEADLTIKNITKPINFRAEFDSIKKEVIAKFKIDRTLWGVIYNNLIKNEAISDAIGFEINLSY